VSVLEARSGAPGERSEPARSGGPPTPTRGRGPLRHHRMRPAPSMRRERHGRPPWACSCQEPDVVVGDCRSESSGRCPHAPRL